LLETRDLKINNGNLVIGTSGKGIDFSATAGTGTSELLDDYEEGTWTPSLGGTATYAVQSGTYTKVGRIVSYKATLLMTSLGTGSQTTIGGLPFTALTGINGVDIGYYTNLASTVYSLYAYVSGTGITFVSSTGNNASVTAPHTTMGNTTYMELSGTYQVS